MDVQSYRRRKRQLAFSLNTECWDVLKINLTFWTYFAFHRRLQKWWSKDHKHGCSVPAQFPPSACCVPLERPAVGLFVMFRHGAKKESSIVPLSQEVMSTGKIHWWYIHRGWEGRSATRGMELAVRAILGSKPICCYGYVHCDVLNLSYKFVRSSTRRAYRVWLPVERQDIR